MEIATLIPIIIIILLIQGIILILFFDSKFFKIQDEIRELKKDINNENFKLRMKNIDELNELKDFIRNRTGQNK